MVASNVDLKEELKKYYGFDSFKGRQEEIINSLLSGKDTFVIMPTGGGKSLCYQLPAIVSEGTAIIISPLIALMKNQVDSIRSYSSHQTIAHFLNSSLNRTQMREVKEDIVNGVTKMVFVAPETLTKEENIEFFKNANISFVAVDEAHCISEWGHDFRPEYRRIREMITAIGNDIPIIALTATATPKVQSDIVKNLDMEDVNTFVSSFNRDNLFYEVRPKKNKNQTLTEIVQFIKKLPNKSGIIYVQARKTTEEIAEVLRVNGISATGYHAGLDAKTRSQVQDDFLMENIDVIVATIAFGMGIDKPDVRFVIHYDIPKSIENYYQETGRAGRDGLTSSCLAFYNYKDIHKLEKFLRDKPAAERDLSMQLMDEVIAFSETSSCRRRFLLHYFGESSKPEICDKMCDNCKDPKEHIEVKDEMKLALNIIESLSENYGIKMLVDFTVGKSTKEMKDYRLDQKPLFGKGKSKEDLFWYSLYRQAVLNNLCYKDIESYGLLKLTEEGRNFIKNPNKIAIPINRDYDNLKEETVTVSSGAALDDRLMKDLIELRKKEAKKHGVNPWIIFEEPSLQDMATYYPTSKEELVQISGVNAGKAEKYGTPFIELIADYVEEYDIDRVMDFQMKQVANNSKNKVAIIQSIDRKMPLSYIAENLKIKDFELLDEIEKIVEGGTKVNIKYILEDMVDEDIIEDIYDYFHEADSSSLRDAFDEYADDEEVNEEDIRLVRIAFLSDVAN